MAELVVADPPVLSGAVRAGLGPLGPLGATGVLEDAPDTAETVRIGSGVAPGSLPGREVPDGCDVAGGWEGVDGCACRSSEGKDELAGRPGVVEKSCRQTSQNLAEGSVRGSPQLGHDICGAGGFALITPRAGVDILVGRGAGAEDARAALIATPQIEQ